MLSAWLCYQLVAYIYISNLKFLVYFQSAWYIFLFGVYEKFRVFLVYFLRKDLAESLNHIMCYIAKCKQRKTVMLKLYSKGSGFCLRCE